MSPTAGASTRLADLPLLTRRAQNRALLARQLLLERSTSHSAEGAIEHLLGLQAQTPRDPYLGLWSRLDGFDPETLGALLTDRQVVRMTLMRATVHLVTAGDGSRLRPLVQPGIERSFKGTWGKRITGVDVEAAIAAARQVLAHAPEPLTGRELAARVIADHGIDGDLEAIRHAINVRLTLVQVPPRGLWGRSGQPKYAELDAWTGRNGQATFTVDDVIMRYLSAFGPASVADFQKWSGLTRCAAVIDRLRPALATFRSESGGELFDLPDAPRPDPDTPAPVRFLPEFDNVLLSHAGPKSHRPGQPDTLARCDRRRPPREQRSHRRHAAREPGGSIAWAAARRASSCARSVGSAGPSAPNSAPRRRRLADFAGATEIRLEPSAGQTAGQTRRQSQR